MLCVCLNDLGKLRNVDTSSLHPHHALGRGEQGRVTRPLQKPNTSRRGGQGVLPSAVIFPAPGTKPGSVLIHNVYQVNTVNEENTNK